MTIDKLINVGNLPSGHITVTMLEENVAKNKNWKSILQKIPLGVAKVNNSYFFTVLLKDALRFGIPHMNIQQVENKA
jgi:hypothetical protein